MRDIAGSQILQTFHPSLVQHAVPLAVQGDGNCLYRAVSRLLYGQENMHKLLRLLTALEIGSFPQYYDPSVRRTSNMSVWTLSRQHVHLVPHLKFVTFTH